MEELVKKIGLDRIAHFGIGGVIFAAFTAMFALSMITGPVDITWRDVFVAAAGGYFVTALAAFIKDYFIDSKWDWWDFGATVAGGLFVHVCAIAGYAMHFLNGRDLITSTGGWITFGVVFVALAVLFVRWVVRFNRKK